MTCPACGTRSVLIDTVVTATVRVSFMEGSTYPDRWRVVYGPIEWEDTDLCTCANTACEYQAPVNDFVAADPCHDVR